MCIFYLIFLFLTVKISHAPYYGTEHITYIYGKADITQNIINSKILLLKTRIICLYSTLNTNYK